VAPTIRIRVYLDTSVFSALFDDRWPERQELTRDFWSVMGDHDVCTSEVARYELSDTPDDERRGQLLSALEQVRLEDLTAEMRSLAEHYIALGAFARRQEDDALHVAAATILRQDVLLSWNFAHLVNRRRRAHVVQANSLVGLNTPDIVAPPEL
jgi:predicted nucleic acid-binding protein